MNWKHNKTGKIIGEKCYRSLPMRQQWNYHSTFDKPTYTVQTVQIQEDDDDIVFSPIFSDAFGYPSSQPDDDDTSSFQGFGGGDTGGAGAGGSWDDNSSTTDSNDSSSDNSSDSSYDSSSSPSDF